METLLLRIVRFEICCQFELNFAIYKTNCQPANCCLHKLELHIGLNGRLDTKLNENCNGTLLPEWQLQVSPHRALN